MIPQLADVFALIANVKQFKVHYFVVQVVATILKQELKKYYVNKQTSKNCEYYQSCNLYLSKYKIFIYIFFYSSFMTNLARCFCELASVDEIKKRKIPSLAAIY